MLDKFDMLSINQTAAQIKLQEAWKAREDQNYSINLNIERRMEGGASKKHKIIHM